LFFSVKTILSHIYLQIKLYVVYIWDPYTISGGRGVNLHSSHKDHRDP